MTLVFQYFPRIMAETGDVAAAEEFLLSDLEDESVYLSVQLFTDNAVNPCINSTYRYVHVCPV